MDNLNGLSIFCLDQSEAAFGSEDFPGSRWRYQGDIVEALAERLSLHCGVCDPAHLSAVLCLKETQHSICLLSASSARVTCPPASIADRAQALARLRSMQPGSSSLGSIVSALKLAALVASTHGAASITAFIAGPCSITSADVPGLVRALAKDHVTIASLATVAELGVDCVAALRSVIDGLNDSSGACLHKLVFLDTPAEDLEHWQQLEKILEVLDHKETQHSSTELASPQENQLAHQEPDVEARHHASLAGARSGEDAGQTAQSMAGSERQSTRGVPVRPGGAQCAGPHHLWHKNRPLLARRSGVFTSAICRNESLDTLGHLSSDGCMRPWLPSYANLPRAEPSQLPTFWPHGLCVANGPKWKLLLDIPGGMMRKMRSHALAPGCAAISEDFVSKCATEGPRALKPDLRAQQAASSNHQGASESPVQPPELCLDGVASAASSGQAGSDGTSATDRGPHTGHRRSRGSGPPRRLKPCTAMHPLRLEADSRIGRILLVESRDSRKLLRLIWCPLDGDTSSSTPAVRRSVMQQQSIWERPRLSEDSCAPPGMLMKLPEHELKLTLDPAAVSFTTSHSGQVLVVEQAVVSQGQSSQSQKYKGVFRNASADGQPVDRCLFWLCGQKPEASESGQGAAEGQPSSAIAELPLSAAGAGTAPHSTAADFGSAQHMQHEPGRQRCLSAAEAARMLHEAVQSAASRASREAQYLKRSDIFPRLQMQLQISGCMQVSFEPKGREAEAAAGRHSSTAGEEQRQRPRTHLSGSLQISVGQQAGPAIDSSEEQSEQASTRCNLGSRCQGHLPVSRDACCEGHRPEGGSMERFSGQVDLVVAAASAEAGAEGGQELFEDSALYDVD